MLTFGRDSKTQTKGRQLLLKTGGLGDVWKGSYGAGVKMAHLTQLRRGLSCFGTDGIDSGPTQAVCRAFKHMVTGSHGDQTSERQLLGMNE